MTAPALVRRGGVDALPPARTLAVAPALAAAGLAVSSTGSLVVAAVLVGLGARDRWAALAAVLAVAATSVRFGTTGFGDLAGIQSVLGPAGIVGPPVAAASAWCAAAAVLLTTTAVRTGTGRLRLLPHALASGALAAALVAGPGPGRGLAVRIGATVAAVLVAWALAVVGPRLRPHGTALAVVVALTSVVLAGWPS